MHVPAQVLRTLNDEPVLRHGIRAAKFLSTLSGELLLTLVYRQRSLVEPAAAAAAGDGVQKTWHQAAAALREALGRVRQPGIASNQRPTELSCDTGAGGDHGITKMWNRREFSVSSDDDQSHYLHPHLYHGVCARAGVAARGVAQVGDPALRPGLPGSRCRIVG
jgi:hypothetical protein